MSEMQETLVAAVVQMSSTDDVTHNLAQARRWVEQAAQAGATLICLPEYFCWIGREESERVALAEAFGDGPIQHALAQLARDTGTWLIGGTVPIRPANGPQIGTHAYNTALMFDPEGQCSARYDKIHLFSFNQGAEQHAEGDTMVGGESVGTVQGPFGTLRFSVCYDLRFPELYRVWPIADVIAVPAAFTHTTGLAHWELLLRARAVENQAYVLASGQCGTHPNGWRTFGHSMIIGPWGEVLARHDDEPGVAIATLERRVLEEVRGRLPVLDHRRLSTPPDVSRT
ncbi:MAG: carbon-nitrogen hydrolase family protein [Paraburkholderia sp.]|uniref:carbon-nitrogen hydrolase family protein n=1 Tax=Paraburkholderia sp. TaxID=1926495 RepID=UPI003C57F49E